MRLDRLVARFSAFRFSRDRRGIAAIEFALILPLMLIMLLTGFDVMRMVRCADKIETAAQTLADLTTQESTSQASPVGDIQTFVTASQIAAAPFNDPNLSVTVSAVDMVLVNNVCCSASIHWTMTQGAFPAGYVARTCKTGSSQPLRQIKPSDPWGGDTIPASIGTQGIVLVGGQQNYVPSLIVVDVSYNFTGISPIFSGLVNRLMWRHAYAIPRTTGQVTLSSAPTKGGGQTGCTN